jgi:hypothetical protein
MIALKLQNEGPTMETVQQIEPPVSVNMPTMEETVPESPSGPTGASAAIDTENMHEMDFPPMVNHYNY